MQSVHGECVIKNTQFINQVGFEGGVAIVNDQSISLLATYSNFYKCTVVNPYNFVDVNRNDVSASAIGFHGKKFTINSLCVESTGSHFIGIGSALFLSAMESSNIDKIHLYKSYGSDAPIALISKNKVQQRQCNISKCNAEYHVASAYLSEAHYVSHTAFLDLESSKSNSLWLELGGNFQNCNFIKINCKGNFMLVQNNEVRFDTCCFFEYFTSGEFYTGEGYATFSNSRADSYFNNVFPSGLTKESQLRLENIENFPLCTNFVESCRCQKHNGMVISAICLISL